jgi:hypothetical protein
MRSDALWYSDHSSSELTPKATAVFALIALIRMPYLPPSVENITYVVSVSSPRQRNGDAILGDFRRLARLHAV